MRVLFLAQAATQPEDLLFSTFLNEEITALKDIGIQPHLLSPCVSNPTWVDGFRIWPYGGKSTWKERWMAAPFVFRSLKPLRSLPRVRRFSHLFHVLRIEQAAAQIVQAAGIDVIHSYFAYPGGLGGSMVKHWTGRPLVASFRGMDLNANPEIAYGQRLDPCFDAAVRLLLREADATLYVSEFMRGLGLQLGARAKTAFRIGQGVDLTKFAPSSDRDEVCHSLGIDGPMILTVCGLQFLKGIDTVLRALALIGDDHLFQFVICGRGEERESLEALSQSLGLRDRVHFRGWVGREEINKYFAACDIFVLGSRNDAAPNVILEAMASGRPIVSTSADGIPEYVRDGVTGFLVPVDDPEAMSVRIESLLVDSDLRNRMGCSARAHAEKEFSYERKIDRVREVYSKLTSRSTPLRSQLPMEGRGGGGQ